MQDYEMCWEVQQDIYAENVRLFVFSSCGIVLRLWANVNSIIPASFPQDQQFRGK